MEDAIHSAIAEAGQTIRHLRWFQFPQARGRIVAGKVVNYQASIKLGFTIDARDMPALA